MDHPVPEDVYLSRQTDFSPPQPSLGAIKTLEGWLLVTAGDYIIRGVHGEHYACKPDIFIKTYEPAEEEPAA